MKVIAAAFRTGKKTAALNIARNMMSRLSLASVLTESMSDEVPLDWFDAKKRTFIFGIVLIVISLVVGKLVFIPLLLFPGDHQWYGAMLAVYIFSWMLLIPGIILAGIEGYQLVMLKYGLYRQGAVAGIKKSGSAVKEKAQALARKRFRQDL